MKNRIPILLILVLILPFIGIYGWLKIEKVAIQKTVKRRLMEGIPKDELVQFTYAKKDTAVLLDWKHSKEFEFQGEMYDIVTRYYTSDSVTYDLWWDHEETTLNRKLAQLTNTLINQNPAEQSKSNYLAFVIKSFLYENKEVTLSIPFQSHFNEALIAYQKKYYSSRTTAPQSPPPRENLYC